ncbi:MAG: hypothetical protein VCA55_01000 [Verrucomicrobiales bacterium]
MTFSISMITPSNLMLVEFSVGFCVFLRALGAGCAVLLFCFWDFVLAAGAFALRGLFTLFLVFPRCVAVDVGRFFMGIRLGEVEVLPGIIFIVSYQNGEQRNSYRFKL